MKINRAAKWISIGLIAGLLTACQQKQELKRFDAQFLELFDTVTSIVGYAENQEIFTEHTQDFYNQLKEYHQLYDIYHDYDGIANLKTINDKAGIEPVKVDQRIIEMLDFSIEMYDDTDGMVNIAMGSVLELWHEYRTAGLDDPANAEIPPMNLLEEANQHTDISKIIIDHEASTVYLEDPEMSLDVGSTAKGYATEQIVLAMEAKGIDHFLVSVGGNVRAIGKKADGEPWKVGIQNPDLTSQQGYLHTVPIDGLTLVTSGAYQRYYTVDGLKYHHIVHPQLLTPWHEYESVSILCKDSGLADALSTAVFNMSLEDGMAFVESLDGVEAMWIMPDQTEARTAGFLIEDNE